MSIKNEKGNEWIVGKRRVLDWDKILDAFYEQPNANFKNRGERFVMSYLRWEIGLTLSQIGQLLGLKDKCVDQESREFEAEVTRIRASLSYATVPAVRAITRYNPPYALRSIRRVLADSEMFPAEKCATIAAILLAADKRTWEVRIDREILRSEFHMSPRSIDGALGLNGKAIGPHLERVGRGQRGVWHYRILPDDQESESPHETADQTPDETITA